MNEIVILGVPIACLTPEEALAEIERLYDIPAPALIAYANAHTLNIAARDDAFRAALERADLILNDGAGVALAARFQGRRFPTNLNGSDFNPLIVERAASRGWPLYLLGARPGVADKAARLLSDRHPGLNIAGTNDGFFTDPEPIANAIAASGAGVLMTALGNPLQELFLARWLEVTGARLGVGVGAFFDFTTGVVPRAPAWMNRMGVEWLYRLGREPERMWRRYVLGNPLFLARAARERLTGGART